MCVLVRVLVCALVVLSEARPLEGFGFERTRRYFYEGGFFPQPRTQRSELFRYVCCVCPLCCVCCVCSVRPKCPTSAGLAGQLNGAWMLLAVSGGVDAPPPRILPPETPFSVRWQGPDGVRWKDPHQCVETICNGFLTSKEAYHSDTG